MKPSIGLSTFARKRFFPEDGSPSFSGTEEELIALVQQYWYMREPGTGETTINRKILVSVDPSRFRGTTVEANDLTCLQAFLDRREPKEKGFLRVVAVGKVEGLDLIRSEIKPDPLPVCKIVLYSAEALLENGGERSTECHWEIVAMSCEPMDPITMARNFLRETGGTFSNYTAEEFAASIWYWRNRCVVANQ